MQDPNEDTEWNDVLRAKGILPPKPKEAEITEDDIIGMIENTIEQKANGGKDMSKMGLDELDELEDSEDEAVLEEYRRKRIAELQQLARKAKFGSLLEISGQDYDERGDQRPAKESTSCCTCTAEEFRSFVRAIATTCIPNYPERNLPTIFIYYEGQLRKQFVGMIELGGTNLTCDELEYMLGQTKAIESGITEDPRKERAVKDKMFAELADNNDW
ncbi:hypothetical protein quinque_007979 [Culex quinquefasciatus]